LIPIGEGNQDLLRSRPDGLRFVLATDPIGGWLAEVIPSSLVPTKAADRVKPIAGIRRNWRAAIAPVT
jgi:hypothetical protein